jgi:hypothetical protein
MATDFVFINSFSKHCCNKKRTLNIESAASTGSHGKYMTYVSSPGLLVLSAHDRKRFSVEVIGSRQTILISTQDSVMSTSTIPFKLYRERYPIKITFVMTINKAQG